MNSPALPHATAGAAAIGQASGRRRAAAAPEGRTGHAPARHADARESAASGQADQTDDGEAASGRGSNCPPPRASETARPRQRTAKRRRGGRRRRRSGGTRARLLAAYSLPSAQKNATQGRASRERGRRRARRARRARKSARIARPASAGTRARPPEARRGGAPTAHRFPLQALGMG